MNPHNIIMIHCSPPCLRESSSLYFVLSLTALEAFDKITQKSNHELEGRVEHGSAPGQFPSVARGGGY